MGLASACALRICRARLTAYVIIVTSVIVSFALVGQIDKRIDKAQYDNCVQIARATHHPIQCQLGKK